MDKPQSAGKRSFLVRVLFTAIGMVLLPFSWMGLRFAAFTSGGNRPREITRDQLEQIQPGEPYQDQKANAFLMRQAGSYEFTALDDRCTHLGCRLQWVPGRTVFQCPCHGSEFDVRGKVLKGPASKPLVKLGLVPEGRDRFRLREQRPGG